MFNKILAFVLLNGLIISFVSNASAETNKMPNVVIGGDLRYRLESIDLDTQDARHRHRIRVRLNVKGEVTEDLSVTIGIGSGSSNDPVSSNQSLDGSFASKPIWLDLAYFNYNPNFFSDLTLMGGKMKSPFKFVGKNELFWDSDLNPEGFAFNLNHKFNNVKPFVNAGAFWVEERSKEKDSFLLGTQAGLKLGNDNFYVLGGGRYFDYRKVKGEKTFWDSEDSFGNSTSSNKDGELFYVNDYNIAGAFLELGGNISGLEYALFGDSVRNVAIDENNNGWLVGAKVGDCKNPFNVCARYAYSSTEKDAVVGVFSDSDFAGGTTDSKGHEVNLSTKVSKKVKTSVSYFNNHLNENNVNYQRVQIDLSAKF